MKIVNETTEFTEFYYPADLVEFGADHKQLLSDYDFLEFDEFEDQKWAVLTWNKGKENERNEFYHLSDFIRFGGPWGIDHPKGLEEWHGYKQDGYCGIVVIKLSKDGQGYKIAYCHS